MTYSKKSSLILPSVQYAKHISYDVMIGV